MKGTDSIFLIAATLSCRYCAQDYFYLSTYLFGTGNFRRGICKQYVYVSVQEQALAGAVCFANAALQEIAPDGALEEFLGNAGDDAAESLSVSRAPVACFEAVSEMALGPPATLFHKGGDVGLPVKPFFFREGILPFKGHFFFFCCCRYSSTALATDGTSAEGAWISIPIPASVNALTMLFPKDMNFMFP